MAKFQDIKRIDKNDFPEDQQPLVEALSFVLNPFMEDVVFALNKNLDTDNFRQETKEIEVMVDSNGFPVTDIPIKNNLSVNVTGIQVVKVENLTTPNSYANYPMIYWNENKKIITIRNIQGLDANNKYKLRIITIG